jgi:hypothetical protein
MNNVFHITKHEAGALDTLVFNEEGATLHALRRVDLVP